MMKVKQILILLVFFCGCAPNSQEVNEKQFNGQINNQSLNNYSHQLRTIDSIITNNKCSIKRLIYDTDDTLKITLFYSGKEIYKLVCPQFGVVGDFAGYESIYFNQGIAFASFSKGMPLSVIESDSEKNNLTFFDLEKGLFFSNLDLSKNIVQTDNAQQIEDKDLQCEIVKKIDELLHKYFNLEQYQYTMVECINANMDFKLSLTSDDSVPIYITPNKNSEILKYINKNGLKMKYLKADSRSYNIDQENSYFILIRLENSLDSGWIFLNNLIFPLDHEDAPDPQ